MGFPLIFFLFHLDLQPVEQVFVPQRVQLGHVYPEVGCLEEILDLPGIRVEPRALDVDVWREDTVDDRSKGGGGHARVALLANGLV